MFRSWYIALFVSINIILLVPQLTRTLQQEHYVIDSEKDAHLPAVLGPTTIYEHSKTRTVSNSDTTRSSNSEYLLSVPFYVYEEMLHDANLLNFTDMLLNLDDIDQRSATQIKNASNVTFQEFLDTFRYWNHATDIHLVRAALEHPNRVLNPEKAKLFIVPSLITADVLKIHYKHEEHRQAALSHLERIDDFLQRSKYFQRNNGADHITFYTLFRGPGALLLRYQGHKPFNNLIKCNTIQFYESDSDRIGIHEEVRNNRTWFRIFYNTKPGSLFNAKYARQNLKFQVERDLCSWMNSSTYSMPV